MRWLYKYPQAAFPYCRAGRREPPARPRTQPEYELVDTGIFDEHRYFDVFAEYAKADPDDLAIRITVVNRGPEPPRLHLLPTVWFRNTWSWSETRRRSRLLRRRRRDRWSVGRRARGTALRAPLAVLRQARPTLLFTENETNTRRLVRQRRDPGTSRTASTTCVVNGRADAVNPDGSWHQGGGALSLPMSWLAAR